MENGRRFLLDDLPYNLLLKPVMISYVPGLFHYLYKYIYIYILYFYFTKVVAEVISSHLQLLRAITVEMVIFHSLSQGVSWSAGSQITYYPTNVTSFTVTSGTPGDRAGG